ncbi:class A beta-lactamase-related serine hydrolase [Ectobacillus sp. JY-23]|uniref:serine hydrolase n=1 Tax=Ectobacillus sp. JY-23 TaxID=2933872 RepID=UPI001FF5BC1C|nr:serine hydrolase [Ectobacillus sp. JY-23]UOY91242.1 class A beta-lactamase-related serine hydrolase [Ectobacillus sp. JY-23]
MNNLHETVTLLLEKVDGRVSLCIEGAYTYAYHAEALHVPASLIKMPILWAGLPLNQNEQVLPHTLAKVGGSGIIDSLSSGATLTVRDLLTLMINVSDNTATNWLIERIGKSAIQSSIAEAGLTQTALQRYMMQSPEEAGGDNVTCAADMVRLLRVADHSPQRDAFYAPLLQQQFRSQLPGLLEYSDVEIANKTGSVRGVLHDAARFRRGACTLYVAVLMSDLQDVAHAGYIQARIGSALAEWMQAQ